MSDAANPTWDLFVSYADADRGWVEGYLLDGLRAAGVRCLTQADFGLGEHWTVEFERAAAQSHRVLLVLSRAYLADVNQRLLDSLARYHELKTDATSVIPLLLEDVELPLGLEAKVSLRATTDAEKDEALKRLCHECQVGPPTEGEPLACPYPGMAPFDRRNTDVFFGRQSEIEELLQTLRHRSCLFLIGGSGSGKSSLVLAGLLPHLEKDRTVHVMRPGATPATTLAALTGAASSHCLLVVDQFEEVYTRATADESARFQKALYAWVKQMERMLLVTVRSDFYPDLQNSQAIFPLFQANHRPVLPLGKEALREAIVEPAKRRRVIVEPELVERLLADAAGAANEPCLLPHLQETLQLLWTRRLRRCLPLKAYEKLGRDGRTGLQQAMAVVADAALDSLEPPEQALAQRTLLRLVQFGEGRADTRRSQPLSALQSTTDPPGALERVLERLTERRLIVKEEVRARERLIEQRTVGNGDQRCRLYQVHGLEHLIDRGAVRKDGVRGGTPDLMMIDLAHEALIAGWPKLREWVQQGHETEKMRRRLEDKAREWKGYDKKAALLDEAQLREAENWLSKHGDKMGATADLRELVEASRKTALEQRKKEEYLKNKEKEQAATDRRITGRMRIAGGFIILTILAILLKLILNPEPPFSDWEIIKYIREKLGLGRPVRHEPDLEKFKKEGEKDFKRNLGEDKAR